MEWMVPYESRKTSFPCDDRNDNDFLHRFLESTDTNDEECDHNFPFGYRIAILDDVFLLLEGIMV
jgi:hypothetical protein